MVQNNDGQMDVERENAATDKECEMGWRKRKLQMSRGVTVQRAKELRWLYDTGGRDKT